MGTPVKNVGQVNRELLKLRIKLELVRGKDYYYFVGEELDDTDGSIVYVPRISILTLEQWIEEAKEKRIKK